MSDFEYTVTPPGGGDRRWEWEGGPVSFDGSEGREILDWATERERM